MNNCSMLVKAAIKARKNSYAPYSGFRVGAALLTADGKVFTGCNIENAAYGPSMCAERTAIFKAVSEGERSFTAIAIAGWDDSKAHGYAYPCGTCRQVMMEFTDPDKFNIIVASSVTEYKIHTLKELFPEGFGPDNLHSDKIT